MHGSLECANCGAILSSILMTNSLKVDTVERDKTTSTIIFSGSAGLLVRIDGYDEMLRVDFNGRNVVTIGRSTPEKAADVDLTMYDAVGMGVSRQHAMLSRFQDALYITDLGSSNGTRVNGIRLVPKEPHIVHDVDEIQLARLKTKWYWA